MGRYFTAPCCLGLLVILTSCASTGGRSDNAESATANEASLQAEGWKLEEDGEPLPSREAPPPSLEQLAARDFDLARPTEPRNPYDTWENRQFRRIVPPAQR